MINSSLTPPVVSPDPVGAVPPAVAVQTLPNGLRLWRVPLPDRRMAAIQVTIHGGDAVEPASRSGLARLLATVCARPADDLTCRLELAGVTLSGDADHDGAFVTALGPGERLAEVAGLVASAVTDPALRTVGHRQAVARRLAAIRSERVHPLQRVRREWRRLVHGADSPYGRDPGGTETTVAALDLAAMADCHQRRYGPASTSVLVTGDLDCWPIADRAAEAFGAWRHEVTEPGPPRPAPASAAAWAIDPAPGASQVMLMTGGMIETADPLTLSALELAVNALGGWFGSRLNLLLRERLGCSYGVHAEFRVRKAATGYLGEYLIYGSVEAPALEMAIAGLVAECAGLAGGELGDAETQAARNSLLSRELMLTQTVQNIAVVTGTRIRCGFGPAELAARIRSLRDVTPAEVAMAAAEHLRPGRLRLAAVGDPLVCERALAPAAAGLGLAVTVSRSAA